MGDYSSTTTSSGDSELQEFLMAEKQKAQVQAQVSCHTLNQFQVSIASIQSYIC